MATSSRAPLQLEVDGQQIEVPDEGRSLLDVLRDEVGLRSPKDGCSPQGQCGCCTVLVDGQPRVACVTPARRSEEHTSELQSLMRISYAVFCLKQQTTEHTTRETI